MINHLTVKSQEAHIYEEFYARYIRIVEVSHDRKGVMISRE